MAELFGNREIVLTALVGSHNYNLNTATSDRDFKYFVAPSFEDLYHGKFFSGAQQTDTLDFDVHDIRQLANLVWKANINFVEVLFSTDIGYHKDLSFLYDNRNKWATMNLPAFRNATYGMHRQKMEHLHDGTAKTDVLVEKFGYDTKQACHALRCLYVLEKFGEHEDMGTALWFNNGKKRDTLLKVKAGGFTEAEFLDLVDHWHVHVWGELSKNFNDTRPDEDAKAELDELMFNFVKNKMLAEK